MDSKPSGTGPASTFWGSGASGMGSGVSGMDSKNSACSELTRSSTGGESVLDAIQDPDSLVFDPARSRIRRVGFGGYLLLCLLATVSISAAAIGLWSDLGCGPDCVEFLQEQQHFAPFCGGTVALVILALYLLDFFCPPHLPGRYCTLSEGGSTLARSFLFVAVAAFVALCFLSAKTVPTGPLVVTIFLCPIGVMLLRQVTMPRERFARGRASPGNDKSKGAGSRSGFELRMEMLKMLTGEERDQKSFYLAATYAFLFAGALSLCVWVPWAASDVSDFDGQMFAAESREERELIFVRWAAPMIVSVSNFIFASFTGLRVVLNRAYTATDEVRNRLIIGGTKCCMNQEMMDHRIKILRERLEHADQSPGTVLQEAQDRMQQYLVQHISHMRQLSNIVKSVGCALLALIGAMYVAFQLTAADSQIAMMVQYFLGACFLTFILVIFVSFGRLWQAMSIWLTDLPLWKSAAGLCRKDWARALALCLAFPFLPLVVALSVANQFVRRLRGLCKEDDRGCLTERVRDVLCSMREWNWVRVVLWCYIFATVLMIYKMAPIFLNVLLAWMSSVMEDLHFCWILVATFLAGLVLFMLPPIPGPPIYLFGGVVISEKCPWGFWWGSAICITLNFAMKIVACAIQQKIIGEHLGNWMSVRRAVGVHKPLIRAIEQVLRRPGLSFGKCMILCGGPDWPTSVLAGILRVSLKQCLLGTCPIILNVVPMTLTGSFYWKREESQVWMRAGNLMFSLTALMSCVFWSGMGWAIQDVFDREHEQLSRPKEEFVELEWQEHRAACMSAKCAVVWSDMPCVVKALYSSGAACLTSVGVAFFWRASAVFGTFELTDDIRALRWFGGSGLVKPPGVVGLSVAAVSYTGLVVYLCWSKRRSRAARAAAAQEVDAMEDAWKRQRLQVARDAANASLTPRSFGSACLPRPAGYAGTEPEEDAVTSAAATNSAGSSEAHDRVGFDGTEDTRWPPSGRPRTLALGGAVLEPIQEARSPCSCLAEALHDQPPLITDLLPSSGPISMHYPELVGRSGVPDEAASQHRFESRTSMFGCSMCASCSALWRV